MDEQFGYELSKYFEFSSFLNKIYKVLLDVISLSFGESK